MTSEYNRHGIQFLYPQNWQVADEQLDQTPRSVTIQSESGAFWSLDIHPFSADPAEIVASSVEAMRGEYDELEVEEMEETICGEDAVGADLSFWCLDFVVECQMRAFRHGHATFALTYQAEDREFDQLRAVFAAVTTSLLRDGKVEAG